MNDIQFQHAKNSIDARIARIAEHDRPERERLIFLWGFMAGVLGALVMVILALALTACAPTPARLPMVQRVDPTETAQPADNVTVCAVTAEALNVRGGPGLQYPVVGALYGGDLVTVTQTVNGWLEISAGWINGRWCK
jgi:hypothetical protein